LVLKREEEEIKALELEAEKEMLRSLLTASSISKRLKSLRDVDQTGILHPPKEIDPGTDANLQFPESILERLEAIEKDGTTLRRRAAQDSKLLKTAEGIMEKTAPTLRTIPELEP
jgi:ribosome-binding ATPase YchF (GTP1/OBG family)